MFDGTNVVSIETESWRKQTIEFARGDRAKDQESQGIGGKLSSGKQAALSGVSRADTAIMICPQLVAHM
eukprot:8848390-Pyramimonas_sp.AAC.1